MDAIIIYYLLAGGAFFISLMVRKNLASTYQRWGETRNRANITGAQTAHAILKANRMDRVQVRANDGKLTDHYNPRSKTIQLSEPIYGIPSVAAMAVAAHEAGHAIQDEKNYIPLEVRTFLAPVAAAGAKFGLPATVFGLLIGIPMLVQVGVIAYVGALFLQFLTLPVEFNASKRAIRQLEKLGVMDDRDKQGAQEVLRAAALTYVAGAASSAGYVIYLVILGGRWILRKPALASSIFKPPPLP